jgi:hypothetical protein
MCGEEVKMMKTFAETAFHNPFKTVGPLKCIL